MDSSSRQEDADTAPTYTIPPRRLGALEHPMIIKNLDKGIKTFGQNNAFQAILDSASPQISVPLYLRYDNPTARPLTSHNALTHNVVLKVTVPKRTGRKRKRGTNGPWEGEVEEAVYGKDSVASPEVLSRDRLDTPRLIRRKLQDNIGKYTVEPIGVINNTHRYRGLADFQYALGESKFMQKFVKNVLPGDVTKLKEFTLQPGIESGSNIDLIPPPYFTPITLPFGYNYAQNPHTKEITPSQITPGGVPMSEDQEYDRVINVTSRIPAAGYFIAHDEYPVPSAPRRQPDMSDPQVAAIITEMRLAMDERPIWTRRSMWNRLGAKFAELPKNGGLVRHCLQYAGYQFKGGPWRDALVRYGLDPRTDPKYRVYQTLIFKLHKTRIGSVGRSWQAVRRKEISVSNFGKAWQDLEGADEAMLRTHIFNGESFSTDGKVWQVCDITDPLLAKLFADAEIRKECDVEISGFYHRVLWSVAKAIMKCKMVAIRFNRTLTDADFKAALEVAKNEGSSDSVAVGTGNSIGISLPDLGLTAAEYDQLRGGKFRPRPGVKSSGRGELEGGSGVGGRRKRTHYRVRIPLKEAEEREAVKMIKLLTQGQPGKRVIEGAAAGAKQGESVADTADRTRKAAEPAGAEGRDEDQEEETEHRDAGSFQEILEDMDEEGSEDEEDMEGGESGEEEDEEGIPGQPMLSFQGGVPEEAEQEEEEEEEDEYGGYSEEDGEEEEEEEEEEEDDEDGFGHAEDEEEGYGEEEGYYDEEGEGFPQPWEEGGDFDNRQHGNTYYQ
ncbi:hypothetical protein VTI74DRAFT_8629 [Chaetomium olivicolor]